MEEDLVLMNGQTGVVEFCEPRFFRKIVQQLHQQQSKQAVGEQQITFFENNKIVTLENQLLLFDLFTVPEWIQKQVLKRLIEKIERDVILDDELRAMWLELQRKMFVQLGEFVTDYALEYDFSETVKISEFLKSLSFEILFDEVYEPLQLLELLFELNARFNLYDRIVIVDSKKYLQDEEINIFYQRATILKQAVVLIESTHDQRHFYYERKLRIHDDFTCELLGNMV